MADVVTLAVERAVSLRRRKVIPRRLVADLGLDWEAPAPFDNARSLAQAVLEPTRIYVKPLLPLVMMRC